MTFKSLITKGIFLLSLVFLFVPSFAQEADTDSPAQEADIERGKALFTEKLCASCHNKNMKDKLVGPALGGSEARWENKEDLYTWIRDPQGLLDSGHEYANQIFEEYNKVPMTGAPDVTDQDIIDILAYIQCTFEENCPADPEAAPAFSVEQADAGKAVFAEKCASCHNRNMKDNLVGPALGGAEDRWSDYPPEDLYSWIRNSEAMVADGHPRANEVYTEWNNLAMTSFVELTDEDIDNLLVYIDAVYEGQYGPQPVVVEGEEAVAEADNTALFLIIAVVLGLLALVMARILNGLKYTSDLKKGKEAEEKSLLQLFLNPAIVGFVVFALFVGFSYKMYDDAVMLGRQQGYQPEQPIQFSHATHAGQQQIDCQYCHDGARRSRHSIIPAANTCMNCHKAITKGTTYGTAEITKIFASIGYDPNTGQYIENYDQMSEDEIASIFQKWIKDNVGADDAARSSQIVEEQWEGIVSSLTDKEFGDDKIQGPIEWVKIHNLPDHVYYNHAQHVDVGKLDCQQCHGLVEEMEVVEQYSPLSMGWCLNCHRTTNVQFAGNEYYEAYTKYHKEMTDGKRQAVTVEDIGGSECQKCHY